MPPWLYLRGLAAFVLSAGSRPTYILGRPYAHGVWFYFPVLFLLKSQLTFLLLLAIAATTPLLVKPRPAIPEGMKMHWRSAWVSLVVFVAVCMINRLDLSIRHFLIALAILALLLAPLPRMFELLRDSRPQIARIGVWVTLALALASIVTAIRIYPNYFPYVNALGMGREGYALVNDSNLDWNQALPEVEKIVQERGLKNVLLDEYGFSDPTVYVPQATRWNCQQPGAGDGGQYAVVSASSIADARNCTWLMNYPHQTLAGGSMYGFQLPETIPAAGQPGGPPLAVDYRNVAGTTGFDPLAILLTCVQDPQQLQPTWDHFQEMMKNQAAKK